ncbi:MAG: glutamate--tRNA ligase [Leptolyngbyaceae cyanobacterium bins.59]|nr:glutamate--tRNA ligase [Leptolyngbyaceae cyanobacterium bins.59]
MVSNSTIADLLIPKVEFTPEDLRTRYPSRALPEGAMVTRFAPSPTGFFHIGGLYTALISHKLARQSQGVFFLRIEDTDKKREVEGAADLVIQSLRKYGLIPDEGETGPGLEVGQYGPYRQSARVDIYHTFVYRLLLEEKAYACFATPEELEEIRSQQEKEKIRPGYYGPWAIWRNRSQEEVRDALNAGKPYVIRLKSPGDINQRVLFSDLIRGELELPENDQDIVILKSDGLPTYHAAHVIDDHLMGTTHVLRGDEWVSSVPLHLQLFQAFGWVPPLFGHIAPIQKMDGNSRRKLSKRKDPEASVLYYDEQGYPKEAVIEYLMNLADSGFEEWRTNHLSKSYYDFNLEISRCSRSGALFDAAKLGSISKEVIGSLNAIETYEQGLHWATQYNPALASLMSRDPVYSQNILNIERESEKVRKDITKWSDLEYEIGYFFDDYFFEKSLDPASFQGIENLDDIQRAIQEFIDGYDESDDKDQWFHKLKIIASNHGYAESTKAFKKNPTEFKGHVGDIAKLIRMLLTGRNQSPDLWEIMRVMGKARCAQRLNHLETLVKKGS